MQIDATADEKVPASQAVALVAPVGQKLPSGHSEQLPRDVPPVELWYLPLGQSSAALAPSSQYEPAGQSLQVVLPSRSWYVPAGHFKQDSCPGVGLYVPGAHAVSLAEPTEQNVPSEHVRQSPSPVMNGSDVSMRLPPGHGSGAAEPSAQ